MLLALRWIPTALAAGVLSLAAIPGCAATIHFTATDVADAVAGQNLWRYDYTVAGSFLQSEFFDIFFDPASYGTLTAGPPPNGDWDVMILQQPAPGNLPPFDVGMFDALALTDSPSLAGTFSVTFIYLGAGSPGSQRFEVYGPTGAVLDAGLTSAAGGAEIPEPATALLVLGGAALAVWRRGSKPRRIVG